MRSAKQKNRQKMSNVLLKPALVGRFLFELGDLLTSAQNYIELLFFAAGFSM